MFLKNFLLAIIIVTLAFWIILLGLKIYTHHGQEFPVPDFTNKTLKEVAKICDDKDLRFEINDSIFIEKQKRGTVVDQNPQPGEKVKKNRTIFFTINALNQLKVKMPNVVGGSVRQAKARFEALGLKIGKLIYVKDFARNNILKQKYEGKDLEKDTFIQKGSNIDLVVGNGMSNTKTGIPNLIGLTLSEARDEITDAYLNYGKSYYDETIENFQDSVNAKVYRQYPEYEEDKALILGHRVNIWLTVDTEKIPID